MWLRPKRDVTNLATLRALIIAQGLVLVQVDQVFLLVDQSRSDHLHPSEAEDEDEDGDGDQLALGPRPVGVDERKIVPAEDRHFPILMILNELCELKRMLSNLELILI